MSKRARIPEKLKQNILYESAFACVVCQARKIQIHHIDQDNSNNDPNNLVVLCHDHHDDAHSSKSLSQNLTPSRLRTFKHRWIQRVNKNRNSTARLVDQKAAADAFSGIGLAWGYINHRRVSQLLDNAILKSVDQNNLQRCLLNNIVDQNGILIQPEGWMPGSSYIRNTIYDWFPHGDDHALHKLYSGFVDQITKRVTPIHLDDFAWNKRFIGNCLQEGQYIFFTKAQYFKQTTEEVENAHRRVRTTKNKITVEYYVDTVNMFGTTSISVSFTRHKVCSSFVQIKSINKNSENWIMDCTPIALGVGFKPLL